MKKNLQNKKPFLFLGILIFLLVSCEDITVTTEIFPDGTCERVFIVLHESKNIFDGPYVIPMDDTWETKEERDTDDKKKTKYTAKKRYATVAELNENLQTLQIKPYYIQTPIRFEKRHHWFFIYFTYTEVYQDLFPFKSIPISSVFAPEDLSILMDFIRNEEEAEENYPAETLENMENKFMDFLIRVVYEDFFNLLINEANRLENEEFNVERIVQDKDQILQKFLENPEEIEEDSDDMFKIFEDYYKDTSIRKLKEQNEAAFREFDYKLNIIDEMIGDKFLNKVKMPGLITRTNAFSIEGSTAIWEFEADRFFLQDFDMFVESRMVNWLAVGITTCLFIALLFSLFAFALVRRKRNRIR